MSVCAQRDVTPVAYGRRSDRVTLTGMAQPWRARASGWSLALTGTGMSSPPARRWAHLTDAAGCPYYSSLAIGFYEDGTAFIATRGHGDSGRPLNLSGGINKVRSDQPDGSGGLTLLTSTLLHDQEQRGGGGRDPRSGGGERHPRHPRGRDQYGGPGAGIHRQHRHPRGQAVLPERQGQADFCRSVPSPGIRSPCPCQPDERWNSPGLGYL